MAKVLYQRKLGVIDGVTLVSHKWVSDHYGGTHGDPIEYLKFHGKAWTDVVKDVAAYYNQFEEEQRMLEQLQAQIEQLQQQVAELQGLAHLEKVPDWACVAVNKAVEQKIVDEPNGGSLDFYRLLTIIDRKGLLG